MRRFVRKAAVLAAACAAMFGVACTDDQMTDDSVAFGESQHAQGMIVAEVEKKLKDDGKIPMHAIDVEAEGGVVTLSGQVANQTQKTQAEALAKQVDGVNRVENRIQIARAVPIQPNGMPPAGSIPGAG